MFSQRKMRHKWSTALSTILLLLLAACGGSVDEAVEDVGDTDTGAVDSVTESEAIEDSGIGATGSEEDSGGIPPTPDAGSKVEVTRITPEVLAAATTTATPASPTNRTGSQETTIESHLDLVLVLDATGSMAAELAALKAGLAQLSNRLAELPPNLNLRYGFVTYRDGAKTAAAEQFALSDDWALFVENLTAVTAAGGGDYPEDLVAGLLQAVTTLNWDPDALKLLILMGDAPPHQDRPGSPPFQTAVSLAAEQNVTIFAIGSDGLQAQGEEIFQTIAAAGGGRFYFLSKNPQSVQTAASAVYQTEELSVLIAAIVVEFLDSQSP